MAGEIQGVVRTAKPTGYQRLCPFPGLAMPGKLVDVIAKATLHGIV